MTNSPKTIKTAILVGPGYFPLDILGAHAIFGFVPNAELHLVWKDMEPFNGFPVLPGRATTTFADCPEDLDVLVIGAIGMEMAEDQEMVRFLQKHAARGCHIIGICAGSIVLAAAGLLKGRRATSNFQMVDMLPQFGAIPVKGGQVVVDDNFYTAGPATGCIEASLMVLAKLRGEEAAKYMELLLEYAPHPLFGSGGPELADEKLVKLVKKESQPRMEARLASALRVYRNNQ